MKRFFRPYGPAFIIGMMVLACCVLFVLILSVCYTEWYAIQSQHYKDQTTNVWLIAMCLGLVLLLSGIPTTPSKK